MNSSTGLRLLVARKDLQRTRVTTDPDAPSSRPLADGEVRLCIDHFALTANNLTYAAFGEAMRYWSFFPVDAPDWGCVPVWGFATVDESRVAGIEPGRRIYGFLPLGTHLVVQPTRLSARGFADGSAHRSELAEVYNQLVFCDQDPDYDPRQEALQAILRPLFTTAFLIDDFFAEAGFFGARQLLLSSASSKTAYATAFCLAQRRGQPDMPRLIGLTSTANRDFVQALGCFDEVVDYADASTVATNPPSAYIDFAGQAALRRTLHERLADSLQHSCSVGGTHWQALGPGHGLPGPRPTLFFAPAQIAKRSAAPPAGWGRAELQRRIAQCWQGFIRRVDDPTNPWLQVSAVRGADEVVAAFAALRDGQLSAHQGMMLSW